MQNPKFLGYRSQSEWTEKAIDGVLKSLILLLKEETLTYLTVVVSLLRFVEIGYLKESHTGLETMYYLDAMSISTTALNQNHLNQLKQDVSVHNRGC